MATHGDEVVRRVNARVGLVGNPSDGYGGAVFGTVVPGLAATVTAERSGGVEFRGVTSNERWPSLAGWRQHAEGFGHVGEQRIISAAMWALVEHIRTVRGGVDEPGVRLTWSTDVPRSVGLAGSSALAVGVIDATAALWGVPLDRRVLAALALSAEREVLGIAAGWQDRIIQSFGCSVLVDAGAMDVVEGLSVPAVSVLAPAGEASVSIELLVGWNEAGATSSDDYHGPLRSSAPSLAAPMNALAGLARRAARAYVAGDVGALASAVDEGWMTRQACAPLRADHAGLVEMVRSAGLAATTPGSGGAVVAICAGDEVGVARAVESLVDAGCAWQRFDVAVGRV